MESILDTIDEELSFGDGEDVEMMDIEEGEVVDGHVSGETSDKNDIEVKVISQSENLQPAKNTGKRRKKKKKNKKKNFVPQSDVVNIDRFVVDVCKRLRERKSYLVYTAIGVLGIAAVRDLVKEVEAVQVCGGQKTVLGDRYRSGGGVLWNILKARDPNAYKEIMKKGRDFEKQFRRPSVQPPSASDAMTGKPVASTSDNDCEIETPVQEQLPQPSAGEKRVPVHERIRVPVSYDDLPVEEPANDQSS
ncbi:uncharacterized protein LOC110705486 [Chenopodium quinoa]|uniref:uncharacterized protein LOC110705486 n=1 Tax=Chenopodium quinoa TaxID=63459 RepID=UPI000B77A774|nr:uncharacterized protein LOC110705486 [Chenopodium quinoa]